MQQTTTIASIALAVLLTGSVWAHHSVPAVFEVSQTFTLTATLIAVDWRNPHIHVSLEVKDSRGEVETWLMEVSSPKWFRDRGVSKSEFVDAIGQVVNVEALRARDGSLYGFMEKITFQDGHSIEGYREPR